MFVISLGWVYVACSVIKENIKHKNFQNVYICVANIKYYILLIIKLQIIRRVFGKNIFDILITIENVYKSKNTNKSPIDLYMNNIMLKLKVFKTIYKHLQCSSFISW